MKPNKTAMIMVGLVLLVAMIPQATAETEPLPVSIKGSGVSTTWTWMDSFNVLQEIPDVVTYSFDVTCYGETDCQGEVLISGSLGNAACYIERGDSWYHGTIRILDRTESCHDVPRLHTGNIFHPAKSHSIRVTAQTHGTFGGVGNGIGI